MLKFQLSFLWHTFMCFLLYYLHRYCLLNSCMCLLSMQQILSLFLHLVKPILSLFSSSNIPPFIFFLLVKKPLIHNLKYQFLLHHLFQFMRKFYLFLCRLWNYLYPTNITLHFVPYFGFRQSYQSSDITLLLNSNIDRPK